MGAYGYGLCHPYGSLALTNSSPVQSFVEPISLLEAKTYLNLPDRSPQDLEEDNLLVMYITAARVLAEQGQQRDLVVKQWDLSLDWFYDRWIELRRDLISVDLCNYRDSGGAYTALLENVDYIVDPKKQPGVITPVGTSWWPSFTGWPSSAVLVRFTSGITATHSFWSDSGSVVRKGMLSLISDWFSNRLPFDATRNISEYPYAVTACLNFGVAPRVR